MSIDVLNTRSQPVAITMGDPAGIGPEIILKAFALSPELTQGCCVFGDVPTLQNQLAQLAPLLPRRLECVSISDVAQVRQSLAHQLPVFQCGQSHVIVMGQVSAQAGALAAAAIRTATQAALMKEVAAIVTAPLNKKALQLSGEVFPGHTEMLQFLAADHLGLPVSGLPVRMMLSCSGLRVVLVSIHLPLRKAIEAVTLENLLQTFQVTHDSWLKLYGYAPRMKVAGLNPHAGEEGLFGEEEIRFISPAIEKAQALGLNVTGPYPPDTVFMHAHSEQGQKNTDVVVAMYHDQGLIPVKFLGLEEGVNQTLGLPFVRTSPDHGTAFDIAGKGMADPRSLLAALKAAKVQPR